MTGIPKKVDQIFFFKMVDQKNVSITVLLHTIMRKFVHFVLFLVIVFFGKVLVVISKRWKTYKGEKRAINKKI